MSINANIANQVDTKPVRSLLQLAEGSLRSHGASLNAAWRHEMERAQFENWFKPFDPSSASMTDNRTTQTANVPGHSSAALPSRRLHLPAILKESEFAPNLDPSTDGSIEETGQQLSMVGIGGANVTHGADSAGVPSSELELELGSFSGTPYSRSAVDGSNSAVPLQSSVAAHSSNAPLAQMTSESISPRPAQIAMLPSARVLSEVSIPLNTRLVSNPMPHEEAAKQHESSESVKNAYAELAQGALLAPDFAASPVRLHVQWQGQSVNIWLGMDGNVIQVSSQSQIVVAELRRHFAAVGQRIGRIVCNGSVVFDGQSNLSNRSDSLFAVQVDAHMRVRAQAHHNVNSNASEFPSPHPQEKI